MSTLRNLPFLNVKAHRNDAGTTLLFEFAVGDSQRDCLPLADVAGEIYDSVVRVLPDGWTAQWTDHDKTTIEAARADGVAATGADLAVIAPELAVDLATHDFHPVVTLDLRPILAEALSRTS